MKTVYVPALGRRVPIEEAARLFRDFKAQANSSPASPATPTARAGLARIT
jgi:hypothetical protein